MDLLQGELYQHSLRSKVTGYSGISGRYQCDQHYTAGRICSDHDHDKFPRYLCLKDFSRLSFLSDNNKGKPEWWYNNLLNFSQPRYNKSIVEYDLGRGFLLLFQYTVIQIPSKRGYTVHIRNALGVKSSGYELCFNVPFAITTVVSDKAVNRTVQKLERRYYQNELPIFCKYAEHILKSLNIIFHMLKHIYTNYGIRAITGKTKDRGTIYTCLQWDNVIIVSETVLHILDARFVIVYCNDKFFIQKFACKGPDSRANLNHPIP
jgi:hypothetical protein